MCQGLHQVLQEDSVMPRVTGLIRQDVVCILITPKPQFRSDLDPTDAPV